MKGIDFFIDVKMLNTTQIKIIMRGLSIAVFGTFLGHGLFAISIKPSWIPLLTAFGFSKNTAISLLPIIGTIDILVACIILFKPFRLVLIWASFWAFAAALSRPIAGEPIWEFVERAPNWITPLALLALHEFMKPSKNDIPRMKLPRPQLNKNTVFNNIVLTSGMHKICCQKSLFHLLPYSWI